MPVLLNTAAQAVSLAPGDAFPNRLFSLAEFLYALPAFDQGTRAPASPAFTRETHVSAPLLSTQEHVTLQHDFFAEDPEEFETVTFVKMKPDARQRSLLHKASHVKPTKKASYEASSSVQRWLKQQAYDFDPPTEQQQELAF